MHKMSNVNDVLFLMMVDGTKGCANDAEHDANYVDGKRWVDVDDDVTYYDDVAYDDVVFDVEGKGCVDSLL